MILYEVHTSTAWHAKCSVFVVALDAARLVSVLYPRRVLFVSRLDGPFRHWLCTFRNGRVVVSFLNTPEFSQVEA